MTPPDADHPVCEGCGDPSKLQCPSCIKMGLPNSYWCGQECFKKNFATHKAKHGVKPPELPDNFKYFMFTGSLRPWKVSPKRDVLPDIVTPDYATHVDGRSLSEETHKKVGAIEPLSPAEIKKLRKVCRLGREVIDAAHAAVAVGVTTDHIDQVVHEACMSRGCYPSPLNYYKFPKSVCTSVNEVICPGIPDSRPLRNGDIVNVDVTVYKDGFHADLNETFMVGNVDDGAVHLVKTAYDSLMAAIDGMKPGMMYRDIGNIISKTVHENKLSVVRTYCGHGIGTLFHSSPSIPHYAKNKAVGFLKPGHVFTIEPMINEGMSYAREFLKYDE